MHNARFPGTLLETRGSGCSIRTLIRCCQDQLRLLSPRMGGCPKLKIDLSLHRDAHSLASVVMGSPSLSSDHTACTHCRGLVRYAATCIFLMGSARKPHELRSWQGTNAAHIPKRAKLQEPACHIIRCKTTVET